MVAGCQANPIQTAPLNVLMNEDDAVKLLTRCGWKKPEVVAVNNLYKITSYNGRCSGYGITIQEAIMSAWVDIPTVEYYDFRRRYLRSLGR